MLQHVLGIKFAGNFAAPGSVIISASLLYRMKKVTWIKIKWKVLTIMTNCRLSADLVPLIEESLPPDDEDDLSVSLVIPNTTAPPRTNPTTKKQIFTTVGFISHRSHSKSGQSYWELLHNSCVVISFNAEKHNFVWR